MRKYILSALISVAGVGCSVSGKQEVPRTGCEQAILPSSAYQTTRKVDLFFDYPDESPPILLDPKIGDYFQQTVAAYFGFGYNNVDIPEGADFIARQVQEIDAKDMRTDSKILYSNDHCTLREVKRKVEFLYVSGSAAEHARDYGACHASHFLLFAGFDPKFADSLVIRTGPDIKPSDDRDWDVNVRIVDKERLRVGFSRNGPNMTCLLKAKMAIIENRNSERSVH